MSKISAIADILEEDLTTGGVDKLVVFGIHRVGLDYLFKRLSAFGPVMIHGGTPARQRQESIDKFQNDPTVRVFIGQTMAAGLGINLQNCSEVCMVEQSWTPSDNAQAVMRCHRIGQKNSVRCRIFSLYASVDEHVQDTLTRKMKELSKIL